MSRSDFWDWCDLLVGHLFFGMLFVKYKLWLLLKEFKTSKIVSRNGTFGENGEICGEYGEFCVVLLVSW